MKYFQLKTSFLGETICFLVFDCIPKKNLENIFKCLAFKGSEMTCPS